jgi:CRISPR system Cascade subunit CasD
VTTLLLRLQGPMQSWGTQSQFRDRDTGREPSKSGVIGLVCAAIGRPRWDPLDDLAALRMGVRVDGEGILSVDYHTALIGDTRQAVISHRSYLSDAAFLVGLEGDRVLLLRVDEGLGRPRWQTFLGRKAFAPADPVRLADGVRDEDLLAALGNYPLLQGEPGHRRFVLEDPTGTEVRMDVPLSFAHRRFAGRTVRTDWLEVTTPCFFPVSS